MALAASPPSVPPAPVLTSYPSDPNGTATSTFSWTDSQAGVSFLCSVENGKFFSTVTPPGPGSPQPCSSPLTYNVSTTNNGTHQFAVEAVDAYGNVSTPAKYSWKVPKSALPLTISGNGGPVYPGGVASAFQTTITNPNTGPVTVTSLTVSLGAVPAGCQPGWFTITQSNVSPSQPITVPGSGSVTLPDSVNAPGVTAPSVSMSDSGDQTNCQTATIPVSYDNTYSANFSVGAPSPFTVNVGAPSGGLLYPTTLGSPLKDTVPVTVSNPSPGAEWAHTITYEVTPGWTQTLTGHPNCTASDFSIDGKPVGTVDTVTVNTDVAPGGHISPTFTIQLVNNGLDQDACETAHVGLTVLVSGT
jgi:hypothetical protein